MPQPCYPSDLSDQEWTILEPLLSSAEKRGRPPKWPLRHVPNAVFYLLRSGCSWRMLPREYPPWQTVYYHFRRWRIDGRLRRAHDRLPDAVRDTEGRERDPSAAVVDSQVVKTTPVGGPERGYVGAKRLAGRKRHLLVDTNGLVLAARVHSADLPDRDGRRRLFWARGKSCQGWSCSGPTALTWAGSASGCAASWGGGWRCPTTATDSYGAMGWRRSHAACRFCLAVGSWRGPSRGWVCRET